MDGTTKKTTAKGKGVVGHVGDVFLLLGGLGLIAAGVDNVAVTVSHVQLPAPGALAVQVVFVLAGVAIGLRGLDAPWGTEVRGAWNGGRSWPRTCLACLAGSRATAVGGGSAARGGAGA